jgi:hypothetical protein
MIIKRILALTIGAALVLAGILGLILSIGGLVLLPQLERQAAQVSEEQIDVLDRALVATMDGLITAETSLGQAAEAIAALEGTMAGVGQAIDDTIPVLDVAAELLSVQLPSTIETTQDTLTSVATSAQLVDDFLSMISAIPFLGTDRYNPDTSLYQGFQDVADGLEGMPELLLTAGEGLYTGTESLQDVQEGVGAMGGSISEAATSLDSAKMVLEDYQEIVSDLRGTVSYVRESLTGWLRAIRWGMTLTLIWLGVAQIGLITQGWERLGRRSAPRRD